MEAMLKRILEKAKVGARTRLASRSVNPLEQLLGAAQLEGDRAAAGTTLLRELGIVLGADPRLLRADDILQDLLRVNLSQLALDANEARAWSRHDLRNQIEPFAYELMALLERLATKDGWRSQWRTLQPRPRSEDEWLDRIMRMNVAEFIAFFSAAMVGEAAS